MAQQAHRAVVLTISDSGFQGERVDTCGPLLVELLTEAGLAVVERMILPDHPERISRALREIADQGRAELAITTGGTGLAPTDHTPEATLAVIDRRVDGLAEAMRLAGMKKTPHAALSRGVAGCRGATLIVNLPGSPKGAVDSLKAVLPALPHGLDKLTGDTTPCAT